ncbi:MAG TPA: hypothetical protein VII63_01510 [Caulobacteraceae bacterium]
MIEENTEPGQIVILNGAPRSGKSSIVAAIQDILEGPWMNLGVDVYSGHVTPQQYRPGIGLRPGGERPDLEPFVQIFYAALYESIRAHSRLGLNVVVDVGHHDAYRTPLGILGDGARRLAGLPVLFVGVRCPIEVIMARRTAVEAGREGHYVTAPAGASPPEPVQRWQDEVHRGKLYDLEVDTASMSPAACARLIRQRLKRTVASPTAFQRLAAGNCAR